MTRRKQVSKRRWKARAKAGKWIPMQVVLILDQSFDLSQNWGVHDRHREFLRLRRLPEVTS